MSVKPCDSFEGKYAYRLGPRSSSLWRLTLIALA